MENAEDKPNYYSVIPADVRYDKELTANAKLLYGEISALCSKNGKCWATNGYFAKLYNTTPRTISKWITSLISKGYIYSELDMDAGKRTLKICMNFFSGVEENFAEDRKNVHDNIEEMFYPPLEENFQQNNININNTRINNKNINNNPNPSSWKNKTYFEDTELNDLFLDFLDLRKKIKAVNSDRAINNLVNKLNKYDDETKKQMINNSITNSWKDVYEIKGTKPIQAQEEEDPIVREEIYDGVVYGITKKGDRISLRLVNDPRLQNN